MNFDDFGHQVEAFLMQKTGWTEANLADFISPRARRLEMDCERQSINWPLL